MNDYLPFGVITYPGFTPNTPPPTLNGERPTFHATTTCPDVRAWIIGAFVIGVLVSYASRRD